MEASKETEANPEALTDIERQAPPPAETSSSAPAAAAATTEKQSIIHKVSSGMDWATTQFLLAFFSFVVMITSSQICGAGVPCVGIIGYQVSVSTIAGAIALVSGLIAQAGRLESMVAKRIISAFLLLWWIGMFINIFFVIEIDAYTDIY